MIDDIIFSTYSLIYMDIPYGTPGGNIESYSYDGENYDLISSTQSGIEVNYAFII